ncbi:reverse transcriptase domain-containing protein [Tanacetum coccineum]
MVPASAPLIGFNGEIIWPMGQILLPVKIGDAEHSTSTWMNFVVVKSPSSYNGIIGRPWVRKIQAVPSTAHEMLKFLVLGGILILRSSRIIPLECTMVSGTEAQSSSITQAAEERIKVAIHPEYPDQTIAIGSTLTEEGRKALCGLLRHNLDIFAWKPEDMTGVPRHLAEHRLNVREGCLPVRQKRRSQAPERNKEIQKEVAKLVDAGVMKEVHYHSWLSNPVMVKKHDDNWRMCVDFKDLNKACPKDGYPLSEIDWKRLVDKAFQKQIGKNLEVYVDDLVIKSCTEQEIMRDIEETFRTLREINIKLNPKKCTFGVKEGTFLGYKISIQVSRKVTAIFQNFKEMHEEKLFPMTAEVEAAFKQMKKANRTHGKRRINCVPCGCTRSRERSVNDQKGDEANYMPRTLVKGQILADFIVERPEDDSLITIMEAEEKLPDPWTLFTDGSSCINGSGVGLILTNPKGIKFTYALRFRFDATNNEAEYEALIAGLRIPKQMGITNL